MTWPTRRVRHHANQQNNRRQVRSRLAGNVTACEVPPPEEPRLRDCSRCAHPPVGPSRMIYVIMGVSGCGKSSFGAYLSKKLGWPLHEGDTFHPQENIDKMARGEPLTDQDRFPWLLKLHEVIERERRSGSDALVACSALKRLYRQILLHGSQALTPPPPHPDGDPRPPVPPDVFFLFLQGDYDLIYQRMASRTGHYMKENLLRSQFEALEPPLDEDNALPLNIERSIGDMVMEVEKHLNGLQMP